MAREDLQDRLALGGRAAGECRALVVPGQDFPEAAVDAVLDEGRQRIKKFEWIQVAARIPEQSRVEIEIPQRPPLAIAGTAGRELGAKVVVPWTRSLSSASSTNNMYLTRSSAGPSKRRAVLSEIVFSGSPGALLMARE